ncbi:DUF5615 family PIN-like protein [Nocardioides luteus]|uniref:DUF5615 family PIN-like protein n=1 Tax=Nocardioides luteus TaxID=1844 RepID=UPI0015A684E1
MRLLLDENLSEKLVPLLIAGGHDVTHVRQLGLAGTLDPDVLDLAVRAVSASWSRRTPISARSWRGPTQRHPPSSSSGASSADVSTRLPV